jgi:hypothetical protein
MLTLPKLVRRNDDEAAFDAEEASESQVSSLRWTEQSELRGETVWSWLAGRCPALFDGQVRRTDKPVATMLTRHDSESVIVLRDIRDIDSATMRREACDYKGYVCVFRAASVPRGKA